MPDPRAYRGGQVTHAGRRIKGQDWRSRWQDTAERRSERSVERVRNYGRQRGGCAGAVASQLL